jgi:hypothetical protein
MLFALLPLLAFVFGYFIYVAEGLARQFSVILEHTLATTLM